MLPVFITSNQIPLHVHAVFCQLHVHCIHLARGMMRMHIPSKGLYHGSEMSYFLIWSLSSSTWCIMRYTVLSWSCLLSFLCNPYIPFLIYEIFHLLVIILIVPSFFGALLSLCELSLSLVLPLAPFALCDSPFFHLALYPIYLF